MLTARLKKLAAFIKPHQNVADIGTDHAYLPIHLAKTGHSGKLIAADVADGPLNKAGANIRRLGLEERIELRKGDGLAPILPGEADIIVIAGMGGLLICDILTAGNALIGEGQTLLLQPMTTPHLLREFLAKSGYRIEDEALVKEGFRLYTILKVCKGKESVEDAVYYYISKPLIRNGGALLTEYAGRIRREFEKIAKNLGKSGDKQQRAGWYTDMADKLKKIEGTGPKNEM